LELIKIAPEKVLKLLKSQGGSLNKALYLIFLSPVVLIQFGCASITGTRNQPLSVITTHEGTPIVGANCNLVNDKGTWYVKTPGSVTIQKAYGDLSVSCKKEDSHVGAMVFKSSAEGATWGNIVAGGLIGYAIDAGTGAGFSYSSTLNVEMIKGNVMPVPVVFEPPSNSQSNETPTTPKQDTPTNSSPATVTVIKETDTRSVTLKKLEDLNEMLKRGLINQKDYDIKKAELLKGM
jgi:hypothetical protein